MAHSKVPSSRIDGGLEGVSGARAVRGREEGGEGGGG